MQMRRVLGASFLVSSILAVQGDPLRLDDSNAEATLKGKNAMVMFMAPWCGACKKFAPLFAELAGRFSDESSVVIAQADCDAAGKFCGANKIEGLPTLRGFVNRGPNANTTKDFNGNRNVDVMERFVRSNLVMPCTREDKDNCNSQDLEILLASEKMSSAARKAHIEQLKTKVKELIQKAEDGMQREKEERQKSGKDPSKSTIEEDPIIVAEVKKLRNEIDVTKAGGIRKDEVTLLESDDDFRDLCESKACMLTFLKDFADGGAQTRADDLKILRELHEKARKAKYPVNLIFIEGGKFPDVEKKMNIPKTFPVFVAVSLKKSKFGSYDGPYQVDKMFEFMGSAMRGKVSLQPLPEGLAFPAGGKSEL